jgi:hypothetical protein
MIILFYKPMNGNRVSLPLYYVNQAGCGFTASKYTWNLNNRLIVYIYLYIKIVIPVPRLDLIGMAVITYD